MHILRISGPDMAMHIRSYVRLGRKSPGEYLLREKGNIILKKFPKGLDK